MKYTKTQLIDKIQENMDAQAENKKEQAILSAEHEMAGRHEAGTYGPLARAIQRHDRLQERMSKLVAMYRAA